MNDLTVLIVSTDPVIGALLALYVEVHQYRAAVLEEGEPPATAVTRSDARILIVDVEHRDGFTPAFIAGQRAAGRRVIAFSPKLLLQEVRQRAEVLDIEAFAMPLDAVHFKAMLEDAAAAAPARGAVQRAPPEARP